MLSRQAPNARHQLVYLLRTLFVGTWKNDFLKVRRKKEFTERQDERSKSKEHPKTSQMEEWKKLFSCVRHHPKLLKSKVRYMGKSLAKKCSRQNLNLSTPLSFIQIPKLIPSGFSSPKWDYFPPLLPGGPNPFSKEKYPKFPPLPNDHLCAQPPTPPKTFLQSTDTTKNCVEYGNKIF